MVLSSGYKGKIQHERRQSEAIVFTEDGAEEYEKYSKWISDENFMFSPDFVPTEDTPQEAIDYYKDMLSIAVDFDDPNFKWPTGIGMNC